MSNIAGSATGGSYKYIRSMDEQEGSWGPWSRMDTFGCATPEALASLLGESLTTFPSRDLNLDITPGIYYIWSTVTNSPDGEQTGVFLLEVYKINNIIFQNLSGCVLGTRHSVDSGTTWSEWYR